MINKEATRQALDKLTVLMRGAQQTRIEAVEGKYQDLCGCGTYHDCHEIACQEVERVIAPDACCPVWMAEIICEQIRHLARVVNKIGLTPEETTNLKGLISADLLTAIFEMYLLDEPKKIKSLAGA